jgi:predicted glycogen debranching enzyme
MEELVRTMRWEGAAKSGVEPLLTREWLVTNGLGGYASGTVAGVATRRYHGLLIAALPSGRTMMLNHLSEILHFPEQDAIHLGGHEHVGPTLELFGADHLLDFRLETGLPVWRYRVGDLVIEKRILLVHHENTCHIHYRVRGGTVTLELCPVVHFRGHDHPVTEPLEGRYSIRADGNRLEVSSNAPAFASATGPRLRLLLQGRHASFTPEGKVIPEMLYRVEESRGYDSVGALWRPGRFRVELGPDQEAVLVASTESWDAITAMNPAEVVAAEHQRRERLLSLADPAVRTGLPAELVLAADQFIVQPAGRADEAARAHAAGDEVRTLIAGYHWFTDWGRDTMISLEGLALVTGRHREAAYILRTFAHYVRDGLIPNLFPEGQNEGLYNTADATLWFFHALDRYLAFTGDWFTVRNILPRLYDIADHHLRGTRFGIGVDPRDGLLRQGAEGYQLTWMDAKVGDWVVTPRHGKAVEINALWYNALKLLEGWARRDNDPAAADRFAEQARRAYESFNRRFWYEAGGYLYDVVDGETGGDASCRPNQVFAISLPHPVLEQSRWRAVLSVVKERLLTPVGLRSLDPGHPDYKPIYSGDLRARDAAYHQGTVWTWLIGPFIDAWLKTFPERRTEAASFLAAFDEHLGEACIGSISEIFDAAPPYTPRGCIAQAWSVAEVLRSWLNLNHRDTEK